MDFKQKYNLKLKAGIDFSIKENHWLPKKMGIDFFVFGKTMFCRKKMETLPKHEFLHIAQFKKYGVFLVLIHYIFYINLYLLKYRNFKKAFSAVPFELEARRFELY